MRLPTEGRLDVAIAGSIMEALTHLGKYRIECELGRGAMGVVYKAFDPVVERRVAIKTIRVEMDDEGLLVPRLQREAKSVGRLEHPNIVTLYDAGETAGLFYLVMQFIEGETLQDRLAVERFFDLIEIQDIFGQICAGLDYAHQRGVIHRDIKPANIMITREGVVKLTDFGIAKVAGTGVTSTGLVVGTPSYMSPEQALGRELDGRSDIFSLGSILYEMMTGEMAFPGQNVTTVMYKIVHETPTPVAALQPGLDPAVEAVVSKALAKHPDQRFQTCAEFASAVQTYISRASPVGRVAAPAYTPPVAPPEPMPSRAPSSAVPAAVAPARPAVQPVESVSYPEVMPSAPGSSPGSAAGWTPVPGSETLPAVASQPAAARSSAHFAWLGGGVLGTLLLVVIILLVFQMRQPAPAPAPAAQPAATVVQPATPAPTAASGTATPPVNTQPAEKIARPKPPPVKATVSSPAPELATRSSPPGQPAARHETPAVSTPAPQSMPPSAPERPAAEVAAQPAPVSNAVSSPAEPAPASAPAAAGVEPETYQAAVLRGDLAFQAGEYQKALAAYLKAYRMNPASRSVKTKIRTVLTLLNRPEDAQKYK